MPMPATAPSTYGQRQAVPLFGLGKQQRSPFISTVKRVNAVVEMTENGRQQASIIGMAGLNSYITMGTRPPRALFIREGELTFYTVVDDQILLVQANLPAVLLGNFTTISGPVWIVDNGPQIFFNDGVTAFIYTVATGVLAPITDPDFPSGARGGTFLQGRFWVYTTTGPSAGRIYGSDQFNGFSWDPLNFFTPEAIPDGIVSVFRWYANLVVFGKSSIEFWSGVSVQVPGQLGFQPITGANTQVGLGGELAYAPVGQRLFFLGRVSGQAGIYELRDFTAVKVSTPAVDQDLVTRINHSVSIATGYMISGHAIVQLTFPASNSQDAVTWGLDLESMLWCSRESYAQPYYRGLFASTTLDRVFITDAFTGTIWEMSDAFQSEGSDPLIFEVTGIHVLNEGNRLSIDSLQLDMEVGLGLATGQGSDPQVMIQLSKDGGHVWGQETFVSLGKIGDYRRRATRRRIGSARDLAVRVRVTDPVPRRLCGAYLMMTQGEG